MVAYQKWKSCFPQHETKRVNDLHVIVFLYFLSYSKLKRDSKPNYDEIANADKLLEEKDAEVCIVCFLSVVRGRGRWEKMGENETGVGVGG
jgi:hypothetical protein